MRLLIDELYPPAIARQLRERGHDVIGVQEDAALRGLDDRTLFEEACRQGRAIVTENVGDFLALDAELRARGGTSPGLILTNNRTFPRGRPGVVGALVEALDALLSGRVEQGLAGEVIWLRRAR